MKYSNILHLALAIAMASCMACNSDSKSAGSTPPSPESLPPASPKPATYLYRVTVDKLNLREASNKNAKVITQFKEGDFVEGTGEVSSNKEEVILRDIPYNEPYFKVKSTTPEQYMGWAYSAALEPVYAGPVNTLPDLGRLSQFSMFLKSLPANKLDSGKKAIDYTKSNFATASGTLADAAFILLEKFLFRMEIEGNFYNMTETIQWADQDYEAVWKETFDMNKYPGTKALAANGFRLEQGEGMIFPITDWAKLADIFAEKVTPPMKEYILQHVGEQKDNAYSDGGIVIGLDTLAERAIFWEKFNTRNPYFVRSMETKETERWLRHTLIVGADNTPVFDYENQTVSDDFKKVWALILQKYPGTKLAKDVKDLSDLCAAEGGKRSQKVEAWITQYNNAMQAQ
jgi:hypothetical protein